MALSYWYYFGSYVLVSTFFPLIYALFDIRMKNATTMMITALSMTILWDIIIYLEISNLPSIYIGLTINMLFITISKLKK